MPQSHPQTTPAAAIRMVAERHGVAYTQTASDVLAHHLTRLSGDDVRLDESERLLIALQRAGHLTRAELVLRQAEYLRHGRLTGLLAAGRGLADNPPLRPDADEVPGRFSDPAVMVRYRLQQERRRPW